MSFLAPIPFYFLRHGHTDWNVQHRCMGQINVVLNQLGIKQAYQSAITLKKLGIKTICYSPLLRAIRTANIINESLDVKMVEVNGLKEANLGTLQGNQDEELLKRWKEGVCPKRAEPYDVFVNRVKVALDVCLSHPGPVLVVSHGGVYSAIQSLLKLDTVYGLENCEPISYIPPSTVNGTWNQSSVVL
jgi:broad specificity phosphatase PhoE